METSYIREFLVLAEQGNYSAAADDLFISQPSLSKHIKALETELGQPLFDRTTRRVHLTAAGKAFFPFAQRIVDADKKSRTALEMLNRRTHETLRIGVIPSFKAYGIDRKIQKFHSEYPQFSIALSEEHNATLYESIENNTVHMAILRSYDEVLPPDLVVLPILEDNVIACFNRGSDLDDGRTCVTPSDLENLEIMMSTSNHMFAAIDNYSRLNHINLNISSRMSRINNLLTLLESGVGDCVLLNELASCDIMTNDLRKLPLDPPISNTISLVFAKNRPVTPAMRAFIHIIFPNGIDAAEA